MRKKLQPEEKEDSGSGEKHPCLCQNFATSGRTELSGQNLGCGQHADLANLAVCGYFGNFLALACRPIAHNLQRVGKSSFPVPPPTKRPGWSQFLQKLRLLRSYSEFPFVYTHYKPDCHINNPDTKPQRHGIL